MTLRWSFIRVAPDCAKLHYWLCRRLGYAKRDALVITAKYVLRSAIA